MMSSRFSDATLPIKKGKPVPTAYLPTFCFPLTWKEPYLETVKVWKAATPGGSSLQDVLDGGLPTSGSVDLGVGLAAVVQFARAIAGTLGLSEHV